MRSVEYDACAPVRLEAPSFKGEERMFTNFFIEFPRFIPGGDSPLNRYISRSVEINITGFSDWGLGIGDAWIGKPYPVTSP